MGSCKEKREKKTSSNNRFSKASVNALATCDLGIQKVFNLAIRRSNVDFGITVGQRTVYEQARLYAQGRTTPGLVVTNIDGVNKLSEHNHNPSRAVDIHIYDAQKKYTYNEMFLSYVAGVVISCAKELYELGEIDYLLTWGNNWDGDGILSFDQNLIDMPHFQIKRV